MVSVNDVLRSDALGIGPHRDRRAVDVGAADHQHLVPHHALEPGRHQPAGSTNEVTKVPTLSEASDCDKNGVLTAPSVLAPNWRCGRLHLARTASCSGADGSGTEPSPRSPVDSPPSPIAVDGP